MLVFVCLTLILAHSNYLPSSFRLILKDDDAAIACFEWRSVRYQISQTNSCLKYMHVRRVVWTHDDTGIMKYLQWLIIRKLANIKITELNDHCDVTEDTLYSFISPADNFIQIYVLSLAIHLSEGSPCSIKIRQIVNHDVHGHAHIHFKRRSARATVVFQQLHRMIPNWTPTGTFLDTIEKDTEQAQEFTARFPNLFTTVPSNKWTFVDSESLIYSNLFYCERAITNFLSLLGIDTTAIEVQNLIVYDSHQFVQDSTWWDQSDVAEHLLSTTLPASSSNHTYAEDFYHLHGSQSFAQYLFDSRQCFRDGTFTQIQSSRMKIDRTSVDNESRCSTKAFDCAFSDLYSFQDRNQMYDSGPFDSRPLKCGFAIPSIFDKVRDQFGRNQTCETVVFTVITNCYDPLPKITGRIEPSFCFVALLDTQTITAYGKLHSDPMDVKWNYVDLGENASVFSVTAKTTESLKILGQRMFPMAKWIIWLDGKARFANIKDALFQARAPVLGAPHPDPQRDSASEVNPTIDRLYLREKPLSERMNHSLRDIKVQEDEYRQDGFYSRSKALGLKMFDIAVFMYRNNHPCVARYLCGWHNEVNYYSYRGQLSVFYPAVRLNLTSYLHYLPGRFYSTTGHRSVC